MYSPLENTKFLYFKAKCDIQFNNSYFLSLLVPPWPTRACWASHRGCGAPRWASTSAGWPWATRPFGTGSATTRSTCKRGCWGWTCSGKEEVLGVGLFLVLLLLKFWRLHNLWHKSVIMAFAKKRKHFFLNGKKENFLQWSNTFRRNLGSVHFSDLLRFLPIRARKG